jgi:hypothetical protein
MNMKEHILTALNEQLARWDDLLKSLSQEQITAPRFDDQWSIQDVIAHLWGWQQISCARMTAAALQQAPEYPRWTAEIGEGWEEDANRVNAWVYTAHHLRPWPEIYALWKTGYQNLLASADPIAERELLDNDVYPWLHGYSLAAILLASYNHHQEHLDVSTAALHL